MQSVDEVGKFRGHQVLLIASAESTEGLSPTIRRCFSHEIRMGSLNDGQRSKMLSQSLQGVSQLLNVCEYNALHFKYLCHDIVLTKSYLSLKSKRYQIQSSGLMLRYFHIVDQLR